MKLAAQQPQRRHSRTKRLFWWLRLRFGAVIAGLGIATLVEAVAFVGVLLPYHLSKVAEAEKRGYEQGKREAFVGSREETIYNLAREQLDGL